MKVGDTVTVIRVYGGGQRRQTATVEKVLDPGNEYPVLVVMGRLFHHRRLDGYSGAAADGAPLSLF